MLRYLKDVLMEWVLSLIRLPWARLCLASPELVFWVTDDKRGWVPRCKKHITTLFKEYSCLTTRFWLAVNGTLMRGFELNPNMLAVDAEFVARSTTTADYRCWSIGDRHPGMIRFPGEGAEIARALGRTARRAWQHPAKRAGGPLGLAKSPSKMVRKCWACWLSLGQLRGEREITETGGWRNYTGHHHIN